MSKVFVDSLEQRFPQRASQLVLDLFPIDVVSPSEGFCVALRRNPLEQIKGQVAVRELPIFHGDAKQVKDFAIGQDVMRRRQAHQIVEGCDTEFPPLRAVERLASPLPDRPRVRERNGFR